MRFPRCPVCGEQMWSHTVEAMVCQAGHLYDRSGNRVRVLSEDDCRRDAAVAGRGLSVVQTVGLAAVVAAGVEILARVVF